MEHHFEKRLPALLSYILICQNFESPSALRSYLEGKGCTVIQQDGTIVGIGATAPSSPFRMSSLGESPVAGANVGGAVEIHAYIRAHGNWHTDLMAAGIAQGRANGYAELAEKAKAGQDREETLCVAFVKAANRSTAMASDAYQFYEEAIAHVRSAYVRHERRSAATPLTVPSEEARSAKETIYLTAREHEILKWVSEGKGCWETGAILGISERTVKFHLQNIYRKLNVVNRAQAITKAMRYSLI
jgi:DNA-binding CsgD family transcriptional regulator